MLVTYVYKLYEQREKCEGKLYTPLVQDMDLWKDNFLPTHGDSVENVLKAFEEIYLKYGKCTIIFNV